MNAVMICLGDAPENQDNNILKLLEVLLSNDAKASEKKKILTEEFDISMSEKFEGEVAKMCNISEGVVEKTWRRGIESDEKRGVLNSILNFMKNASLTFDQATAMLGIPANDREEYRAVELNPGLISYIRNINIKPRVNHKVHAGLICCRVLWA